MEPPGQVAILSCLTQRRPQVLLEWDPVKNKVVAAPTQIGLSWAQASTVATNDAHCYPHAKLVDSLDIPEELLELPDLNDVLKMETWETCLSKSEREMLSIYLPEGVDQKIALQDLLRGAGLHFGNPLQKWGSSVCAGGMHPDLLLQREAKIKQKRKAYTKYLRVYHRNMINNLLRMKEIWADCENLENLLPQIRRYQKSGQNSPASVIGYSSQILNRNGESSNITVKLWDDIGDERHGVDRDMTAKPEERKKNADMLAEEGPKRAKKRERTKPPTINDRGDVNTRPNAHSPDIHSSKDDKRSSLPVGTKRPKTLFANEGLNKTYLESATEGPKVKPENGPKRLKILQPAEGKAKMLQGKTSKAVKIRDLEKGAKLQEMIWVEEGLKAQQMKLEEGNTRRLKTQPTSEGTERPENVPLERERLKSHSKPLEDRVKRTLVSAEDLAKRQQIKLLDKGGKNYIRGPEVKSIQDGTKMSTEQKGQTLHIKGSGKEENMHVGLNARPTISSWDGYRVPEIKSLEKKLKIDQSVDDMKRLKVQQLENRAKNLTLEPPFGKKNGSPKLASKKQRTQFSLVQSESNGCATSDFESDWFKKYVQVTVGPISGRKLSQAIQTVQVTKNVFQDVRLRSEAGEEVHIDTLASSKGRCGEMRPSKHFRDSDAALISDIWQTVLLKDVAIEYANTMQKRKQRLLVAKSVADACKGIFHMWHGAEEG